MIINAAFAEGERVNANAEMMLRGQIRLNLPADPLA